MGQDLPVFSQSVVHKSDQRIPVPVVLVVVTVPAHVRAEFLVGSPDKGFTALQTMSFHVYAFLK
jgi:hypothetical protein